MKLKHFYKLGLMLAMLHLNVSNASVADAISNGNGIQVSAMTPVKSQDIEKRMIEVFDYFAGQWCGAGEFASGKPIQADVSFSLDLDQKWLLYKHTDRAPNKFKSIAVWGVERDSNVLKMVIVDNFKSVRNFESVGFVNNDLVFEDLSSNAGSAEKPVARRERFTFRRLKNDEFQMVYESNKNNEGWKLGDWIIFTRASKQSICVPF